MSEIVIVSKQQRLIIDPPTRTVAVVATGPQGPPGPVGATGPTGPQGVPGSLYLARNRIINGGFDVWQRGGGGFTVNGAYTADQWVMLVAGTTHLVTRQTFTPGNPIPGREPAYHIQANVTSVPGAANYAILGNRIESVRTFAGQQVTFSFSAAADAPKNMAVEFTQDFGIGGSPSPGLSVYSTLVALTTGFNRYTITFTIPSIAGKTLGTSNDGWLTANFWFDAGSSMAARAANLGQQSGVFRIADVQLEAGPAASAFEVKPYGDTLVQCQRYLRAFGGYGGNEEVAYGFFISATAANVGVNLSPSMRDTPTIAVTGAWQFSDGVTGFAASSIAISPNLSSARLVCVTGNTTGATAFRPCRLECANVNTARIFLSSEL